MKKLFFIKIFSALALCLALAGCGKALGSQPVVVSDNSPAYVDGAASSGAAPGGSAVILAGVQTTPAGTLYLDVTDEMYATGRYGDRPDATGCISAAQAADLAANYAKAFADYGVEGGIWKLNMGTGDIVQPGKSLWLCNLSLPKWSQDPAAVPDLPIFRAFTQEELALLDSADYSIWLTLDAATGALISGYAPDPNAQLMDLIFQTGRPEETLTAYADVQTEWLAGDEAKTAAGACFELIIGTAPASLARDGEIGFSARDAGGTSYGLTVCHATGRLTRFCLVEQKKGEYIP